MTATGPNDPDRDTGFCERYFADGLEVIGY
jgi:hypothetical protein